MKFKGWLWLLASVMLFSLTLTMIISLPRRSKTPGPHGEDMNDGNYHYVMIHHCAWREHVDDAYLVVNGERQKYLNQFESYNCPDDAYVSVDDWSQK